MEFADPSQHYKPRLAIMYSICHSLMFVSQHLFGKVLTPPGSLAERPPKKRDFHGKKPLSKKHSYMLGFSQVDCIQLPGILNPV